MTHHIPTKKKGKTKGNITANPFIVSHFQKTNAAFSAPLRGRFAALAVTSAFGLKNHQACLYPHALWFGVFIGDSFLSDAKADKPTDHESGKRANAGKHSYDNSLHQQFKHTRSAGCLDKSENHNADAIQQARNRSSYCKSLFHGVSAR